MTQQDINANLAQCIQSANSIGHATYTNICDGTTHLVYWGSLDWTAFAFLAGFLGLLGLLFLGFIIFLLGDL